MTRERAFVAAATRTAHERVLIAETLRGIRAADTLEATAQVICCQVLNLSGLVAASIYIFEADRKATALGFALAGQADPPLKRLPAQRSRHLAERAAEGTWIEPWVNRPWHPYNKLLTGLGVQSAAYAPIHHEGRVIGLLVVDTAGAPDDPLFTALLPALVEFAELSGTIIGGERRRPDPPPARARRDRGDHPERGLPAGLPAGRRHPERRPPGVRGAHPVQQRDGPGSRLRRGTHGRSRSRARAGDPGRGDQRGGGPAEGRLAQPERLTGPRDRRFAARPAAAGAGRPIVLEITEHVPVEDYPAVRAAIARLRPKVRIAIDDAGSGIANFHHIVELRPSFVKLDISLIRGIDADLSRQAMIVGLLQFAAESDSRTIAEGVETEDELATLRRLGVSLVQGYLLGRPAPAAEWVELAGAASPPGSKIR